VGASGWAGRDLLGRGCQGLAGPGRQKRLGWDPWSLPLASPLQCQVRSTDRTGKVLDQQSLSRSLGLTPALPAEGLAGGGVGTSGGQMLPSSGKSRVYSQGGLQQRGSIILHHSKAKAKLFLLLKSPLLSAGDLCFGSCGPEEWLSPSQGLLGGGK